MAVYFRFNKLEPDLDKEFARFFEANVTSTNGKSSVNLQLKFPEGFKEKSHAFFSKHQTHHSLIDNYFSNFHDVWRTYLDMEQFKAAEQLWDDVLRIVLEWEGYQQKIHKGTPFYWLAGTAILNGELEKGFALMHQALEEDVRTHGVPTPKTPAFSFVTLNYQETQQYFRSIVLEGSKFLENCISKYASYMKSCGASNLCLADFKSLFLAQTNVLEIVFYFVYTLFKARHLLLNVKTEWRQNAFSSLLETGVIFNLCLTIEEAIKEKDDTRYPADRPIYFSNRISFLSGKAGLSLDSSKLRRIRENLDRDFPGVLGRLLSSSYSEAKGIEECLIVAYAFRNFAAHSLESLQLLYEEFEEIFQRILNAFFFAVEILY